MVWKALDSVKWVLHKWMDFNVMNECAAWGNNYSIIFMPYKSKWTASASSSNFHPPPTDYRYTVDHESSILFANWAMICSITALLNLHLDVIVCCCCWFWWNYANMIIFCDLKSSSCRFCISSSSSYSSSLFHHLLYRSTVKRSSLIDPPMQHLWNEIGSRSNLMQNGNRKKGKEMMKKITFDADFNCQTFPRLQ